MRRATSCQAADFCARSISVRSSSTSTKPVLARRGPSELTVTAACRTRPATTVSISRETTPMRSERRIRCCTVRAASVPSNSSSECASRAAVPNMRPTAVFNRKMAPSLQLLHRLLQVVCELVDLGAVVAQLCGHGIEGSHQHAKLVLCLLRDLVVKISSGDFARALGESLDRNGHLLGEQERQPHHGEEQ